jgi:ABC-type oligopeptide transport system substrate-binding subunit
MQRNLRMLAAAGALLAAVAATDVAFAQKPGGVLRVHAFDSPPSMSMHEETDVVPARAIRGVFNNLVMFDQHVKQNSMQSATQKRRRSTPIKGARSQGQDAELISWSTVDSRDR